jgi:hypothetical protein
MSNIFGYIKLTLCLIIVLCVPQSRVFARSEFVRPFADSLNKALGFDTARMMRTSESTLFAHPSLLRQWGIINNSAAATYNGVINTIELEKAATIKDGEKNRLRTLEELKENSGHAYPSMVSTIFHELGHAEYDTLIEEGATDADKTLHAVMENEIRPWLKENYPHLKRGFFPNKVSIALSELYGYYRTDIIERYFEDMDDIFLYNGYNRYNDSCFKRHKKLEAMALTMELEDFQKLLVPDTDKARTPFRDRVIVNQIWIQGGEVDFLKPAKSAFKKQWYYAIWDHFAKFYKPPLDTKEFVAHLQSNHPAMEKLKTCRNTMWHSVRTTPSTSSSATVSSPNMTGLEQ